MNTNDFIYVKNRSDVLNRASFALLLWILYIKEGRVKLLALFWPNSDLAK